MSEATGDYDGSFVVVLAVAGIALTACSTATQTASSIVATSPPASANIATSPPARTDGPVPASNSEVAVTSPPPTVGATIPAKQRIIWASEPAPGNTDTGRLDQLVGNDAGFLASTRPHAGTGQHDTIWFSTNGTAWTALDSATFGSSPDLRIAATDDAFWVDASDPPPLGPGPSPTIPTGSDARFGPVPGHLYRSTDGLRWTSVSAGHGTPTDLAGAGSLLLATAPGTPGTDQVLVSADGVTWERADFPTGGGTNFHPSAHSFSKNAEHYTLGAAHDYDGGLDYWASVDGHTWHILPKQPGSGSNIITSTGLVRAYIPYPSPCAQPRSTCTTEVRLARLPWDATQWLDVGGLPVGSTSGTPPLATLGGQWLVPLVDAAGNLTVASSTDQTDWVTDPSATLASANNPSDASGLIVSTNSSTIVVATGPGGPNMVGHVQTDS